MRFTPDSIGMLVRPRIILAASLLFKDKTSLSVSANSFMVLRPSIHSTNPYISPKHLFGQSSKELFAELNLGDTSQNLRTAYVCQVTNYLVKLGPSLIWVDKNNIQDILQKTRKIYGSRANLKIFKVGVSFFQGVDSDGKPINEWKPVAADGKEIYWFYKPGELVPMSEIIKYENTKIGNLIIFPKTHGLVVKKKMLNKPKFYQTSSWSCYAITLLQTKCHVPLRFLPDRQFKIFNPQD